MYQVLFHVLYRLISLDPDDKPHSTDEKKLGTENLSNLLKC